jgi:hypothetical protein
MGRAPIASGVQEGMSPKGRRRDAIEDDEMQMKRGLQMGLADVATRPHRSWPGHGIAGISVDGQTQDRPNQGHSGADPLVWQGLAAARPFLRRDPFSPAVLLLAAGHPRLLFFSARDDRRMEVDEDSTSTR